MDLSERVIALQNQYKDDYDSLAVGLKLENIICGQEFSTVFDLLRYNTPDKCMLEFFRDTENDMIFFREVKQPQSEGLPR